MRKFCKYFTVKSRAFSNGKINLVIEVRVKNEVELTQEIAALKNVFSCTLLSHDGEVTY